MKEGEGKREKKRKKKFSWLYWITPLHIYYKSLLVIFFFWMILSCRFMMSYISVIMWLLQWRVRVDIIGHFLRVCLLLLLYKEQLKSAPLAGVKAQCILSSQPHIVHSFQDIVPILPIRHLSLLPCWPTSVPAQSSSHPCTFDKRCLIAFLYRNLNLLLHHHPHLFLFLFFLLFLPLILLLSSSSVSSVFLLPYSFLSILFFFYLISAFPTDESSGI